MAKQVLLKQNGVEIYPRTLTTAVADTTKNKLLSKVIEEVEHEALGWTIEPTSSASTLQFTLYKQVAKADGTGYDKVSASTFSVAQDVYLDNVEYIASAHTLEFTYNTASGKQKIDVNLDDLVDVYAGDGSAITITQDTNAPHNSVISLKLSNNAANILSADANGLLATIAATGDTYVSAAIDDTDKNKVVVAADVAANFSAITGSETASGQLADAAQVKKYIDDVVGDKNVDAESKSPEYITATAADNTVTVSAVTGVFTGTASALTATQGIADASEAATAVKAYVDGRVLAEKERVDALNASENDGDYINVTVATTSGNVASVTVDESNILTTSGAVNSVAATGKLVDAKAIKDYVDAKTGDLDSGISGQTSDEFFKIEIEQVDGALDSVAVTAKTQTVADASAASKGYAEASDVKTYVDDQISGLSISATGDTYVNAAVDASNNKKINVSTNLASVTYADSALTIGATEGVVNAAGATAIKNYIDAKVGDEATARQAAIEALDADVSGESGAVKVQVVEADGVITTVAVTATTEAVSAATSATSLATAQDVKSYVDGKVSASHIVDSTDIDATETATGTTLAINFEADGVESGSTLAVKSGDVFAWGVTAEAKGGDITVNWPGEA